MPVSVPSLDDYSALVLRVASLEQQLATGEGGMPLPAPVSGKVYESTDIVRTKFSVREKPSYQTVCRVTVPEVKKDQTVMVYIEAHVDPRHKKKSSMSECNIVCGAWAGIYGQVVRPKGDDKYYAQKSLVNRFGAFVANSTQTNVPFTFDMRCLSSANAGYATVSWAKITVVII